MNRILIFSPGLFFLFVFGVLCGPALGNEKAARAETSDFQEGVPGTLLGGNLRLRGEFRDFRFDKTRRGHDESFLLSRVRINVNLQLTDTLTIFVEGQDSRIFLEDQIDEHQVPTIFADTLDLHQAYVNIKLLSNANPVEVRVGRQKLRYGQERLIGAFEWSNTARVFDAIKLSIGQEEDRLLNLFSSRVVPVDNHNFNDWTPTGNRNADSGFHGIHYADKSRIPHTRAEAYWLFRHENKAGDKIHTLGGRFAWKFSPWDADGEIAGQFGKFGPGIDHKAFALHLAGGYTVKEWNSVRLGLAYNFATGNDDPNDNAHKTFDNLFPTNHLHYGYMDLMSWRNMHNLEFTAQIPWKKVDIYLAYQAFWLVEEDTDAWYNAGGAQIFNAAEAGLAVDSFVGQEMDLKIIYKIWKNRLAVEGGYSHFFQGDYLEKFKRGRDADFAYLQTVVKF